MITDQNSIKIGSSISDILTNSWGYNYYFGLQGNDDMVAEYMSVEDMIFMAGGSGSDSYSWDGIGFLAIVETGGANDSYTDDYSYMSFAAELDNKHLLFWNEYGDQIIYTNYKDSASRIENFYVDLDNSSGLEHYSYSQFLNAIKNFSGWQGSLSHSALGISDVAVQWLEETVADVIEHSAYYESLDLSNDNVFYGTGGQAQLDGGDGLDVVVFSSYLSDYTISKSDQSFEVYDKTLFREVSLSNIERLQFSNNNIALDIEGAGSAGGIYRLYQATFDRVPDLSGLGYWIAKSDDGQSAVSMAMNFTYSNEFKALYNVNTADNYMTGEDITALVTGFYQNVLHRDPDQGGLDFYVNAIEDHRKTVGLVLAEISDSEENYLATIGQIENGIIYEEWLG